MAKADDTSSTHATWMPWDEALKHAGSFEALRPHLHEGRILARHNGLYYWPSREERDGPGMFDSDWSWAKARVDTGRVMSLMPTKWRMFIIGAPPSPDPPDDEVFALGIELERAAVEALWPAKPNSPEPKNRLQPQQELCRRMFPRLFPDGRIPDEVELSTTSLRQMITVELERDAKQTGKKPLRTPSWDAVRAARRNP